MSNGTNAGMVVSSYSGGLNIDFTFKRAYMARKAVLATDHLPNFRQGRMSGVFLAVDNLDEVRLALLEIDESEGQLVLAQKQADFESAREDAKFALGLCACYKAIDGDVGKLPLLRPLGVRMFTMSSNTRNLLCDGCGERKQSGLSYLGVQAVKKMGDLGILVDVSHLSETSFWDLLDNATGTVIASHSNTRALCDSPRNLSDDQIKALASRGGYIGVTTYPTLVATDNPSLEKLLDHIDYLVKLAGAEHVGIGTDFVDYLGPLFRSTFAGIDPARNIYRHKSEWAEQTPGIRTYSDVCNLIDGLVQRGYSGDVLEGILWKNLMRVLG